MRSIYYLVPERDRSWQFFHNPISLWRHFLVFIRSAKIFWGVELAFAIVLLCIFIKLIIRIGLIFTGIYSVIQYAGSWCSIFSRARHSESAHFYFFPILTSWGLNYSPRSSVLTTSVGSDFIPLPGWNFRHW